MANTITITSLDGSGMNVYVTFKIKLTGSYVQVANGGEVLNFLTATIDPLYLGAAGCMANISNQTPIAGDVWCTSGDITNIFQFIAGTASASKLKIGTALGSELGAGAYSALLLSDVLEGMAVFNKNI